MNRKTRDKFASGTPTNIWTEGQACWETAPAVYHKLLDDFGPFDLDLCADKDRHYGRNWLGPGSALAEDALTADWSSFGAAGYANPPYGLFIRRFLPQAIAQQRAGFASTILLPLRVTKSFRAHVLSGASELWFSDRRLIFWEGGQPRLNPKTGKPDSALFDSIVVRYLPNYVRRHGLRVGVWKAPTAREMSMPMSSLY